MAHIKSTDGRLRELALFAGAGGGILGGLLLGWRTVCAVERDAYAAAVLAQRQNDGIMDPFPIWSDVETFDGKPWRGLVDVVSGGFPCTDISCAGKGAGIDGADSGLWREMARIIGEVRPRFVFVENSPLLVRRGLARVLSDLASMGYDARWCCLGHKRRGLTDRRRRIWIMANSNSFGRHWEWKSKSGRITCSRRDISYRRSKRRTRWTTWPSEPGLVRVVDGIPYQVDRLRCLGLGQVPRVAAAAWRILGGP